MTNFVNLEEKLNFTNLLALLDVLWLVQILKVVILRFQFLVDMKKIKVSKNKAKLKYR